MKVMVASLFLLLGAFLLPAETTSIRRPECSLLTELCAPESTVDECKPNVPCDGGQLCCYNCGWKCTDPIIPDPPTDCTWWAKLFPGHPWVCDPPPLDPVPFPPPQDTE
ncbi:nigwaprin-b-like [Rana temporaria]|uniref:nigwaprin-b-like n=1 Tax=Rana temporaria TaxID=8407 RepID=UPI001AAD78C3|nr:nigwaprin-b-like [Rana temporaria]